MNTFRLTHCWELQCCSTMVSKESRSGPTKLSLSVLITITEDQGAHSTDSICSDSGL